MRKHLLNALRVALASILACVVVACVVVSIATYRTEHQAQECFREFSNLQLGHATFADVMKMKDRYGGFPVINQAYDHCNADNCAYAFGFRNLWLSRLDLAPYSELTMALNVHGNQVIEREYMYTSTKPGAEATKFVSETLPKEGKDNFKADVQVDLADQPKRVLINMTTAALPAQRSEAYSIDLSCLRKIGGCTERNSILAQVPII